jgi:exonuclease VII large subunit
MTVPNPIVLENHLKQIQSNLLTFKKEKQELKKSIENEKIQDRKNYYVLKSQLNLLKSKQTELKEKENSIQKQLSELLEQETTTLEKLPNKECYRFVQREENKYYRWSIDSFVHLSELCSRVGGTCLKCNLSSQTVIFIQNHESECSFCLQCIRSFFNEMKLTKEECEGEIQKLHECVAKEKEKHENIMKNFKEKQMILEQMMKSQ